MSKILVSGAGGFIGSHLARELCQRIALDKVFRVCNLQEIEQNQGSLAMRITGPTNLRIKELLNDDFLQIASYVKEAAPWHGRSTYGGLKNGAWRSPSEFCTEEEAMQLLYKAKKSVNRATEFMEKFWRRDEYQKD